MLPDFERQLAQLKEDPGSKPREQTPRPVHDEEMPIEPITRKDVLFTPGLGVEEVSFLGPIRRPGDENDDDDLSEARPLDIPLQPDLLESEADVLEELKKLSARHDGEDPTLQETPTRPPLKIEDASGTGIGGATGDHFGKHDTEEEDDDDSDEDSDEREGEVEAEESNDEDEEDEMEEDEEEDATEDPGKDVASLEERLSASLRELAERRKQAQKVKSDPPSSEKVSSNGGYSSRFGRTGYSPVVGSGTSAGYYATELGPGTAPETASGSAPGTAAGTAGDTAPGTYPGVPRTYPFNADGDLTSSAPISSPEVMPPYDSNVEKGDEDSRAVMKKAHMARKLMDPEDPKKDEDLLELMLRIAENPDEWKRVHHLLRQLDDDLTTYEKTMHRVEALALEKSSGRGGAKKGRKKKPGEKESATDIELRREEMSEAGLPAGSHGENLSSTTQLPLNPSAVATSAATHHGTHKDWPRFAYHRVTTAPHPDFLQQQQKPQEGQAATQGTHHRNAYIAVSVITPPKGRHGGISRPIPSPPPVYAVSPTPESPYQRPPSVDTLRITTTRAPHPRMKVVIGGREIAEETLREPMEEEIVDSVAKAVSRGRHHKSHADPIEEQLRTLAAVEEKLRHHLHEKERMRHLLKEAGRDEEADEHHRSKRSAERSTSIRQHQPKGLILSKTS